MTEQQQPPLLKVSILHFRDQSRDEETWTKWYLEEQIPRFIPMAHKHGIDRVELVGPSPLPLLSLSLACAHAMPYSFPLDPIHSR